MMGPLVSVIVPVFNVEKYLSKCLNSLVNQTLSEIEIIVVNDGSTDKSQTIIDDFARRYPQKIFSFIKENGGLSDARNFGLQYANADFIGFIDSDDFVEQEMYKLMLEKAISCNADIVVCDILYEWEKSNTSRLMSGLRRLNGVDVKKDAMLSPLFAWNKLYHKKFFKQYNLRYPIGLWYEDIPVTLPIFAFADKIAYVEIPLVHYLQRDSSIMGARSSRKMRDIFVIMTQVSDYFNDKGLMNKYHSEVEYLFIEQLLIYGGFRFIRSDIPNELMNEALELTYALFPKWKKNLYIKTLGFKNRMYVRTLNKFSYRLYRVLIRTIDLLKGRS